MLITLQYPNTLSQLSTTPDQCYQLIMGGLSVAVVGYDATDALANYLHEHDLPAGTSSYKPLLQRLETETSTPIFLTNLEDVGGLSRVFLCFYVDYAIRVYDCAELMAVTVPPQFTRVKELLSIEGELRRVFAPQAHIFSWDSMGQKRLM